MNVSFGIYASTNASQSHAAHHAISIYAMGANAELLDAAYATHKEIQLVAFTSPGTIDSNNFSEHLGDGNYYQAYFDYFSNELLNKGLSKTLEESIFAKEFNYEGKRPEMLSRFLGGLLHALIHVGYGAEFGLLSMSAEGNLLFLSKFSNSDESPRIGDDRCRKDRDVSSRFTFLVGRRANR